MSRRDEGFVLTRVGVREVPKALRSLSTFTNVDYIDTFTVSVSMASERSAEDWARAVLERAPFSRLNVRIAWQFMGLRLGPRRSRDHVQGWKIAARGDTWIRLETSSWYLTAEIICLVEEGQVSISLSLRYDRGRVATLVWAFVSGPHKQAVPIMLRQAVRLMTT